MSLSSFILKKAGWKIEQNISIPEKCVICIAPHTSNWDFIIGKLVYNSLKRQSAFLIKKEWLVFPFSLILKPMGAIGVDRSKKSSVTDQVAEKITNREISQIAITPEGTRKRNAEWKKGFYYIAKKAGVPIVLAGFNFKKKKVMFDKIFMPTDDEQGDFEKIKDYYRNADIAGKHPELFAL